MHSSKYCSWLLCVYFSVFQLISDSFTLHKKRKRINLQLVITSIYERFGINIWMFLIAKKITMQRASVCGRSYSSMLLSKWCFLFTLLHSYFILRFQFWSWINSVNNRHAWLGCYKVRQCSKWKVNAFSIFN